MKKTTLAAAVALSLGTSVIAQANTSGLTGIWTGTYTFAMSSPGGGPVGTPSKDTWTWNFDNGTMTIQNTATFYASVWTAAGVTFSDTGSAYDGNMTFSWSVNPSIPVFSSWDVMASGSAPGQVSDTAVVAVNNATILPTSSAFPGFHPNFSGSLQKVPVPAHVWLMGSGLIGLVGVSRRRRHKA